MKKPIFRKTNLQWIVDYDYERSACSCNAYERGDYCRCTTIEHAWVDDAHARKVVNELYRRHSRTDLYIDRYCFDRICYAFKIYNKNLYEVETGGGYYGEEVYGVYFDDEEKIFDAYYEVIELNTPIEKIQYCLNLEYGYLIGCVASATSANLIETSPKNICPPQTEYFKKIDNEVINEYKNRDLPIAVCVKDRDKYRLIDGYHRFVANKDKEKVEIVVLE